MSNDNVQELCVLNLRGRAVMELWSESLDKTFGIVVFEAKDQSAATEFTNGDPAVVAGLATAELHPFSVALARKNP